MPNVYLKEIFDNNNHEKVYEVLSSHLISKKAVSILLRVPFLKVDFDDFMMERQETIKDAIESMLLKEKIEIPIVLQTLNDYIEKIELRLRDLLVDKAGNDYESYKNTTPGHVWIFRQC